MPANGKTQQKNPLAPLHPIPARGEPFERVLIDCVGLLPRTKSGNYPVFTHHHVRCHPLSSCATPYKLWPAHWLKLYPGFSPLLVYPVSSRPIRAQTSNPNFLNKFLRPLTSVMLCLVLRKCWRCCWFPAMHFVPGLQDLLRFFN